MSRLLNIHSSMDKTMKVALVAVGVELSLYIVVDAAERIAEFVLWFIY